MAVKWPEGARSGARACGIKDEGPDLGIIVLDRACAWAGTFTRNAAAAAPVEWSRSLLGRPVRGLVVNSGNANACTGAAGDEAVATTAQALATELGCDRDQILVASTGPIGVRLPVDKIAAAVPATVSGLDRDVEGFARAILTTDTTTKVSSRRAGDASVVGVAKGAAMLAPNMATMLAFIVTDAQVDPPTLQKILDAAVDRSFNRISVDSCESTNDSVFAFATGIRPSGELGALADALDYVCGELAHSMVADAEGGSKVVRVVVEGAFNDRIAIELGRAVAASTLWRAAVFGGDPNWGRIAAALGSASPDLELSELSISIGNTPVFVRGEPAGDLEAARAAMDAGEFTVGCIVGAGPGSTTILTSDLSPDYVTLNATGTT